MKTQSLNPCKILKGILTISFFLCCFSTLSIAQTCTSTATLSGLNDNIELSGAETNLCEQWTIDISGLDFSSEAVANKYFNMNRDNLTKYEVNWQSKVATLTLMVAYKPNWTLADWRAHLENKKMIARN